MASRMTRVCNTILNTNNAMGVDSDAYEITEQAKAVVEEQIETDTRVLAALRRELYNRGVGIVELENIIRRVKATMQGA